MRDDNVGVADESVSVDHAAGQAGHNLQLRKLIALASANALVPLILCIMVPALPGMAIALGDNPDAVTMAQTLLVAPFIIQMFAPPLVGAIVGRFGRRLPLLIALMLLCVAGVMGVWLETFWPLLASRLVCGLAVAAIATICPTLVGDYFAGTAQDRSLAWIGIAQVASSVAALLIAGLLVRAGGWHAPFYLFLAAGLVAILVYRTLPEPVAVAANGATRVDDRLNGALFILAGWMALAGCGTILSSVQLPFLLVTLRIADPAVGSTILGTGAIFATLGAFLYPRLKAALARHHLMACIFMLMGLGYVATGLSHSVAAIWTFLMIMSFGSGIVVPFFTGAAMEVVASAARPRAVGLVIGAMFGGWFVTPFLTAPLAAAVGNGGVFIVFGAGLCACGVLGALLRVGSRQAAI